MLGVEWHQPPRDSLEVFNCIAGHRILVWFFWNGQYKRPSSNEVVDPGRSTRFSTNHGEKWRATRAFA